MTALYPGSFDPPTVGHVAIMRRAARLFDRVIVLVIQNPGKNSVLPVEARKALIERALDGMGGVTVAVGSGLLLDELRRLGADTLLRGLRGEQDYLAEKPVADAFLRLYAVETVFLQCEPSLGFVSSGMAREILRLGGSAEGIIPRQIADAVVGAYGARGDSN